MSVSESIIKPPTSKILAACYAIDRVIRGRLLAGKHATSKGHIDVPGGSAILWGTNVGF